MGPGRSQDIIPATAPQKLHQGHQINIGRVCHVQNDRYDYGKKNDEALAKNKKRTAATPAPTDRKRQKTDSIKVKVSKQYLGSLG